MKRYLLLITAVLLLISCVGSSNHVQGDITGEIPTTQTDTPVTPTPTQTPQAAAQSTEPAATPTPETLLHSGLRDDGSFSSGTLFIGDSLTYIFAGSYLPDSGLLGEAKYTAQCGSQVTAFFSSTVLEPRSRMIAGYSEEFEGMKFYDAAASFGKDAKAIYIMWGTNFTPDATKDTYIEIIDFLLENCPNATIHLQTIPHGNVKYTIVNQRIADAYDHYQQIGEPRVLLIDTYTAIGKHTFDGVHLDQTGNRNWYEAIIEHAKINNLSE